MIRIQYTYDPDEELNLDGSNQELAVLRTQIIELERELVINAETEYDPSPYQCALSRLRIVVKDSLIRISVVDSELRITGRKDLLVAFADSLPWDATHTNPQLCDHVHYDALGTLDVFAIDSLGIVLSLKR